MKFLLPILLLTGCSKVNLGCEIEKSLLSGASIAIATQLKCEGVDAIKADLSKLTSKIGLCSKDAKVQKFSACSILVGMFKDQIQVTPANWKCDTAATKDKIAEILTEACEKVL